MGGGKSSGNQSNNVQLTPEQTQTIDLQNQFLQQYLPTLTGTAQGAQGVYQNQVNPVNQASTNAVNTANMAGNIQGNVGAADLGQGSQQLSQLFSPQYEQQQVAGSLIPAEQAAQRANVQQEAGFAGAGESGSARDALAAQQTQALNAQTMGGIAAQTEAGIEQQQASAANSLAQLGTTNLAAAPGTIGSTINYAETPLSNYGQYASLIYGAPQQTPNYAGTQSSTQSGTGKSSGINLSDARLKTLVEKIEYGLEEVKKLLPVSWLWKNSQKFGAQKEVGFIAQDVQKLIPEIVSEIDGHLGIDYPRLTAVLVRAIQQQQVQIDNLSKKVEEMNHEFSA